jgi:hypothetical protein
LLIVRQDDSLATEIPEDPYDALAVAAIVGHQHLGTAWGERTECSFNGKRAAAQQRHADMLGLGMDEIDEIAADRLGERIERTIPRSPVREHRSFSLRRGCKRAGGKQYRLAHGICALNVWGYSSRCMPHNFSNARC